MYRANCLLTAALKGKRESTHEGLIAMYLGDDCCAWGCMCQAQHVHGVLAAVEGRYCSNSAEAVWEMFLSARRMFGLSVSRLPSTNHRSRGSVSSIDRASELLYYRTFRPYLLLLSSGELPQCNESKRHFYEKKAGATSIHKKIVGFRKRRGRSMPKAGGFGACCELAREEGGGGGGG